MPKRKKPAREDHLPEDGASDETEALSELLIRTFWPSALRLALLADGAGERCGRRDCRREGLCLLKYKEGSLPVCGGGPISADVVSRASIAVLFGQTMSTAVVNMFLEEINIGAAVMRRTVRR